MSASRRKKAWLLACALVFFVFIVSVISEKTSPVDTEPTKTELTVIMYHGFSKDESKCGKYVVTPKILESDIVYLKNIGCNFVSVGDIARFKHGEKNLPENAVLLTFDDGNYNNYTYAFPLLKKYNISALISPIGYWVESYSVTKEKNPAYSIITEEEIREMYSSGFVEFGNHTYNLHHTKSRMGCEKIAGETSENYKNMLAEDLQKANDIIRRCTGENPCALVYPYGAISSDSYEVAKNLGFEILFSCTEGINQISPGEGFYVLKRYNRPHGISSTQFFNKIYKQFYN